MQNLSKEEMKKVTGGVQQFPYTCTCMGGAVGQWIYPNGEPSQAQETQDVCDYCSSQEAFCGYYPSA
jgi:hypothetical protein